MGVSTHSVRQFLENRTKSRQRIASGIIKSGTTDKLTPVKAAQVAKHIGRNDPCICRSGKKFKHCCLRPGNITRADIKASGIESGSPTDSDAISKSTGTHTPDLGRATGTDNVPSDSV
jgi:hypothetical protein